MTHYAHGDGVDGWLGAAHTRAADCGFGYGIYGGGSIRGNGDGYGHDGCGNYHGSGHLLPTPPEVAQ